MLRETPVDLRPDMWNIPTNFTVTNIRHKPFTTVAFLQATVLPGQAFIISETRSPPVRPIPPPPPPPPPL